MHWRASGCQTLGDSSLATESDNYFSERWPGRGTQACRILSVAPLTTGRGRKFGRRWPVLGRIEVVLQKKKRPCAFLDSRLVQLYGAAPEKRAARRPNFDFPNMSFFMNREVVCRVDCDFG